jgi:hypothetical protein
MAVAQDICRMLDWVGAIIAGREFIDFQPAPINTLKNEKF